ncbi:hypothetical protein HSBAA_PA_1080 (plasmid) [Vreelandella sulfidaeris]|uniref:Uncharacterized protein n=1 Tax=Vreelandella sulfidaeris TaxID=115553 RepID=A0A455UH76_9GAMM|nr:hypothetical protein HSBAA_PA_1080 [Halomonas sulfidaeris]
MLLLTDWTFEEPMSVFRNLKPWKAITTSKSARLLIFRRCTRKGFSQTAEMRGMWAQMRMSSRDIADVTGSTYTYLLNGHSPGKLERAVQGR